MIHRMKARLMFSLFSHLEPDLFMLDEAMSVGLDESFRKSLMIDWQIAKLSNDIKVLTLESRYRLF